MGNAYAERLRNYPYDERMLNRHINPTFNDLINFCGESGKIWIKMNKRLKDEYRAIGNIRYPYGTEGWCMRYCRKNKQICDVFAENGAFTLQFRVADDAMNDIYNELSDYAKEAWEDRQPCRNGNGSWITFRVKNMDHFHDAMKIIRAKLPARLKERTLKKAATEKTGHEKIKTVTCKKCGSDNHIKYGFINGVQRYKCKECRSLFTGIAVS